jgi:OmpA-OmpF porin, OOP family
MLRKHTLLVAGVIVAGAFSSACATKKFVVKEVQTVQASVQATYQRLSARLDNHESGIQSNTNQIGELVTLSKENRSRIDSVKTEVQAVDGKATAAGAAADQAQKKAESANSALVGLDSRFQSRNRYSIVAEKVVQFKFGDWKLPKTQTAELDEAARMLKEDPDAVLVLEGRTDSVGDKDYNIQLGQKRLESVARYLVVDKDVPAYRIHKMSFGPDRPLADNKTKEGRSRNRSTVISILAPQTAATTQSSSR